MAGETIKSRAICLRIAPWSRTSHVVAWLTPSGIVNTVVRGAQRPKSAFLGQYDLGYTCELVFYARERAELRALRECWPVALRDELRTSLDALLLADRFRHLCELMAPNGPEAQGWFALLENALDALVEDVKAPRGRRANPLAFLVAFEMRVLELAGIAPEISGDGGAFALRGERKMPIAPAVAACLAAPMRETSPAVLRDATRALGVFYAFHAENTVGGRRQLVETISRNQSMKGEKEQ